MDHCPLTAKPPDHHRPALFWENPLLCSANRQCRLSEQGSVWSGAAMGCQTGSVQRRVKLYPGGCLHHSGREPPKPWLGCPSPARALLSVEGGGRETKQRDSSTLLARYSPAKVLGQCAALDKYPMQHCWQWKGGPGGHALGVCQRAPAWQVRGPLADA